MSPDFHEDARGRGGTRPQGEAQVLDSPDDKNHRSFESGTQDAGGSGNDRPPSGASRGPSKRRRGYPKVKAKLPCGMVIECVGRDAQTLWLLWLQRHGISVFDFPGGPAYRLAAYIHRLRTLGVPIKTDLQPHDGGRHAIYRLGGPLVIIEALHR